MFVSLHVWGAYLFWAIICFCGFVVLGVWMPETSGVPIERMGDLFESPWYLRWCAKPKPGSGSDSDEVREEVQGPGEKDGKQAEARNAAL